MVLPLIGNDQMFKVITTNFSAVVVTFVKCFDVNISELVSQHFIRISNQTAFLNSMNHLALVMGKECAYCEKECAYCEKECACCEK